MEATTESAAEQGNTSNVENIEDMVPEDETKFGVLLLGAPGTGKSTFCKAMHEFLDLHYSRKHCLVNLDPANENMTYPCDIDV